ncbi:MAG: NAD(P)H-hydrate dehydratase [Oscillospiraceae bacterium]|jgi:NAD(P)H-hydrate epimerase|nr:NAD(P)H-hydrate dehydratase [Oscillospiraceae bacterium]
MQAYTYSRNAASVRRLLPTRARDAHKYDAGRVLSICGSLRFPGAAVLAARGAVAAGAGLVEAAFPQAAYSAIAPQLTEPVLLPLPCNQQGHLAKAALPELLAACQKADAVLLGCGLGQSLDTAYLVPQLVRECPVPLILDADALTLIARDTSVLRTRTAPTILTPHAGEMARLTGAPVGKSAAERLAVAHDFAAAFGVTLVLKGAGTLVAQGTRRAVYRNTTGNPGMATAGCGDLLAGMILAYLGQGLLPRHAAECAVYVHGYWGDRAERRVGMRGVTAARCFAQ